MGRSRGDSVGQGVCPACAGEGTVPCRECDGGGGGWQSGGGRAACERCAGEGVTPCEACDGTGALSPPQPSE